MRVRVSSSGLYTYPDASISCGEAKFADSYVATLLNPKVVFEILSASTERYDRGAKFKLYQEHESIVDIVFISQDKLFVEHYRRAAEGRWVYQSFRSSSDVLELADISLKIGVGEPLRSSRFRSDPPNPR